MTAQPETDTPPHPHGVVTTERHDEHVLIITVDRADKRNAFTPKILNELRLAYTQLDTDNTLRCGVLCFAGEHTSTGLDMAAMFAPDAEELSSHGVDPFGLDSTTDKPVVVALQGTTSTAAIEIALAADIVIAADDARFSQMEPRRGLAPIGGATARFVQRAGWGNAMYHLLTADEFDAHEAHRIGLLQEVCAPGTQRQRAVQIATAIAANAPLAVAATKRNARLALGAGPDDAFAQLDNLRRELQASSDFAEGVASFIERRPASFTGC